MMFVFSYSTGHHMAVLWIKAPCRVISNKCRTYSAAGRSERWPTGIQNQVQEDQVVPEDPGYQGWGQSQNLKLDHAVNDVSQSPLQIQKQGRHEVLRWMYAMIRVEMSSREPEKVPGTPGGPGGPWGPGLPTSLLLAEWTNNTCSHTTVTPQSSLLQKKKAPNSYLCSWKCTAGSQWK